jgi:cell division protein FtsI/penicillin-binding protein 2
MKADKKREKLKKKSQAKRDAEAERIRKKEEAETKKAAAKESGNGRSGAKRDKKTEKKRAQLYEKTNADRVTIKNRRRLAAGFAFILICMSALILRMGYWQIYRADELATMAAEMQKVDTEIDPVRGAIYDTQMTTLAETVTEYELYAYTQYLYKDESISVTDRGRTLTKLSRITGKDREEIRKLLEGEENLVLLAEGLTKEQVEQAETADGDDIGLGRTRCVDEQVHYIEGVALEKLNTPVKCG